PAQGSILRRQDYAPGRDYMNPFALMRRFNDEMDRHFWSRIWGSGDPTSANMSMWNPPIDVRERDGNIEVCAELPGINKEDVRVEATDEGLVIEGEKKQEIEKNEGGYHRTERSYGRFYRLVPLPEGANADQAKAEFRNGILQVRVPYSRPQQQAKGR